VSNLAPLDSELLKERTSLMIHLRITRLKKVSRIFVLFIHD